MTTHPQTLVQLFLARLATSGSQRAIGFQREGRLQIRSWAELAADTFRIAAGIRALGVEPGDRVAQLSENRYEWIVTDLAIQISQAIHVPIHATLAAEQVQYQVEHSGAKAVLVSGEMQWSKLQLVESQLPAGLRVAAFEAGAPSVCGEAVASWDDWLSEGDARQGEQFARQAEQQLDGQSLGTIIYTSGTTGQPKGVMLTHQNLVANAVATIDAFGMTGDDVRLTFLPLSHIFARTCDLYTWIANGGFLCLATSRDTVIADCQWAQPTMISGVPYFYDVLRRHLVQQGYAETPGALQSMLGGHMKWCCSGGAALPDHVYDFYDQRGLPILQGYGLTETSPVISLSSPQAYRRGACGRAIDGVEVAISADGEIITRGPHIMKGYWRDASATAEMIPDGWLHTGDLGKVDDDGFVWITGRKKELIVTASGKNVAPVLLESLLTEDPMIEQALVIGDGRSYLTALIVPSWECVQAEVAAVRDRSNLDPAARAHPDVLALFERQIASRLHCVSHHEQVRSFTLLERPFSIERHEMTPKLSLRRPVIHERFAAEIEAMYDG